MKRSIYTLAFLFVLFSQVHSQEYTPFDLTDTKWVMSSLTPSAGNNGTEAFYEVYTKGDTIINDLEYVIIATRNLCKLYYTPDETTLEEDMITEEIEIGAVREEDNRVYFYRFDGQSISGYFVLGVPQEPEVDHLIYDFNAVVGDTIHFSSEKYSIVYDIYENNGKKLFEVINNADESFPYPSDGTITEGKGSSDGLFAAYYSYYTNLRCYSTDEPLNGIACTYCADYITDTKDIFITNADVLYPNPASDQLSIRAEYIDQIRKISVYNIHGHRLSELLFKNGEYNIDLLSFSSGMLIFELEFKNGQQRMEKVMKRQ